MGRPVVVRHPALRDLGWWMYHRRQLIMKRLDRAVARVLEAQAEAERNPPPIQCETRGHDVRRGKRVY